MVIKNIDYNTIEDYNKKGGLFMYGSSNQFQIVENKFSRKQLALKEVSKIQIKTMQKKEQDFVCYNERDFLEKMKDCKQIINLDTTF